MKITFFLIAVSVGCCLIKTAQTQASTSPSAAPTTTPKPSTTKPTASTAASKLASTNAPPVLLNINNSTTNGTDSGAPSIQSFGTTKLAVVALLSSFVCLW